MTEDTEPHVPDVSRRNVLAGAGVLGMLGLSEIGSQSATAQTATEPRIQLGADYAIDDDPDGNGDLVVEHQPSGARFKYDASAGRWIFVDTVRAASEFVDPAGTVHTGELADSGDAAPPETHAIGGAAHSSSTLAVINALVSDATLDDSASTRPPENHGNTAHSLSFVSDGDGIERQIWVIANGASDPAGADPEDIIFEESA